MYDPSSPAKQSRLLIANDISDDRDLYPFYAKALRIQNDTLSDISLALMGINDKAPLVWKFKAGVTSELVTMSIRRIWSTGTVNVVSGGAIISGVSIILLYD